ncbi:MAG TPA: hypothetical protein VHU84_01485, partial [Lacipirellulaceae bacterium]|nr:hypothetical protein [Lacipirellulaceae bacterium]
MGSQLMNVMKRLVTLSGFVGMTTVVVALAGCSRRAELGPVADATAVKSIRDVLAAGKAASEGPVTTATTGTGWATLK